MVSLEISSRIFMVRRLQQQPARKGNDMRPTTLDPTRTGDEAESLEAGLRQRIIGQEDAIRQVVETYQTYVSGMASPGRPIANLMFLGPTGSGKTRLVEATAECLLGNPRAVIKIDCGEFQPRDCKAHRLSAGIPRSSRNKTCAYAGSARSISH